jgi:hypothetical protein
MPVTGMRAVMVIQDDRFCITEAHVINSQSFETALPFFINLFKARMQIAGVPAKVFRGRLSLLNARRVVRTLTRVDLASVGDAVIRTYTGPSGTVGNNDSDQPKSAIQLVLQTDDGTSHSSYLGGVPDVFIKENPEGPAVDLVPGYAMLVNQYIAVLTQPAVGTIVRSKDPAVLKTRAILGADTDLGSGLIRIWSATFVPQLGLGQLVMVRGFKPQQKAFKALTGKFEVGFVEADTPNPGQTRLTLRGTKNLNVLDPRTLGTVELVDYTFASYVRGSIGLQTTRKRGNRQLAGPGRRTQPVRVSL